MRLTPNDIVNHEFTRSRSGVSTAEVEEFLRTVASDYEQALAEAGRLQQRMEEMERKIERYEAMESTLKEALVLAQVTATETRELARREADSILRGAHTRADEIRRDAVWRCEALRQERLRFGWEFRALLQNQIDHLDAELQRSSAPMESVGWPAGANPAGDPTQPPLHDPAGPPDEPRPSNQSSPESTIPLHAVE